MSKNKVKQSIVWLRPFLLSALGGVAAMCAALGLFAFLTVKLSLSAGLFYGFSTAAVCLGCLVSGMIAAQIRKGGGLVCGLLSFLAYALVLALAAAIAGSRSIEGSALLRTALLLPSGCIGGVLGVHRADKQTRRRRTA
jgi:putative membrane protein (TIGR04086 family)